jgi:aldehyde:ferredoxin oxidoreductase
MECWEKGHLTTEQLDGIEARWGDSEAAARLLELVAKRRGIGDLLAEGVKRAAEGLGGPAAACAVYIAKGGTPRGHDHRARWEEMLDTATSSTGTLQTGPAVYPAELGRPARINPFDPEAVARNVGGLLGRRHFEDSLGACIFTTRAPLEQICRAVNAATGWDYTKEEAVRMGRRTAAIFRAFDLRCGIGPALERPSARYGSTPTDGPAAGRAVTAHWEQMLDTWYETVGYDRATGRPRPETLRSLGLEELIPALWGPSSG